MRCNLLVVKCKLETNDSLGINLRLKDFHFTSGAKVIKNDSRVDFFFKGNKCSLTYRGFTTLYISHDIKRSIFELPSYFMFLKKTFYFELSHLKLCDHTVEWVFVV